jgi:hypothetical protein
MMSQANAAINNEARQDKQERHCMIKIAHERRMQDSGHFRIRRLQLYTKYSYAVILFILSNIALTEYGIILKHFCFVLSP